MESAINDFIINIVTIHVCNVIMFVVFFDLIDILFHKPGGWIILRRLVRMTKLGMH